MKNVELKNKSQAKTKNFIIREFRLSFIFTLGNKNGHAQSILFVKSVDGNIVNVT